MTDLQWCNIMDLKGFFYFSWNNGLLLSYGTFVSMKISTFLLFRSTKVLKQRTDHNIKKNQEELTFILVKKS